MINMIQGDCMDLMRSKPDGFYDLAIVDPPYGIGIVEQVKKTTKQGTNSMFKQMKGGDGANFDDAIPNHEYFAELERVSKDRIIWGGNYFLDYLCSTRCFIVWDKMNGTNPMADAELAWTSFNGSVRTFRMHHFSLGYGDKIHPTQKPVKLYEWLLMNYATCKTCGNEGGYYEDVAGDGGSRMWQFCDDCTTHEKPVKILDTHGGSGSICLACHNLGFDLDWIELDQDYYEAAKKRYERHKRQLRMF